MFSWCKPYHVVHINLIADVWYKGCWRYLLDPSDICLRSSTSSILCLSCRHTLHTGLYTGSFILGLLRCTNNPSVLLYRSPDNWPCFHPRYLLLPRARQEDWDLDIMLHYISLFRPPTRKFCDMGHKLVESSILDGIWIGLSRSGPCSSLHR